MHLVVPGAAPARQPLVVVVLAAAVLCSYVTSAQQQGLSSALDLGSGEVSVVDVAAEDQVDFSQNGGDWRQGYCGSRLQQSPIDFNGIFRPAEDYFEYGFEDVKLQNIMIINDGRALVADLAGQDAGGIVMPHGPRYGSLYKLRRIELHALSEHTFRGAHSPLEVQLVHESDHASGGGGWITVSFLVNTMRPLPNLPRAWPALLQTPGALPHAAGALAFDDLLGLFTQEELPKFRTKVSIPSAALHKATFQGLMEGKNFFTYRGSQTLPPCHEQVLWLVRQEPVIASETLVSSLMQALYKLSDGAGNFRTVMPVNQRIVSVWAAKEKPPPKEENSHKAVVDPAVPIAQDAIVLSKAAVDHARDLDIRLQRAAAARLRVLKDPGVVPLPAVSTGAVDPRTFNETWAEQKIVEVMTKATRDAIAEDMKEVAPAAASLARSYLRQNLLRQAGYKSPPARLEPAV
eukprot:CAMPEP_0178442400 /NCGR_PEP_ID=MMETSP0689_2-20121128/38126_1 /TAXON_ID=160604 /ORGANISM="Amphidinium massartii, Strain CS-259" /LENGTH=460 /DNA_ID=CAMNT_0020065907 /DNA_START=21 /DNA_END=1403 /DNA_ORIENTATION=+